MKDNLKKLSERFDKVFIERGGQESSVAQRVLKHFPSHKVEIVDSPPDTIKKGDLSAKDFNNSKKQIFITKFKGQFFKRCPGSKPGLTCCNYFVLNLGQQCDLNCSYCYLQSFLNNSMLHIYYNIDDAIKELVSMKTDLGQSPMRIGTGEVIDSLSLDQLTLYSRELIRFFKTTPHWQLEFKTKSNKVEQFLDLGPAPNTIVSWSINPEYIVSSEEHGTASLQERLDAANACLKNGFKIAFHIDPVIWHPDWKKNYGELVDTVATCFSPQVMPYISLGTLRFQPEQRQMMRERFGFKSWVVNGELFPSDDGKLRYDKSLRQEMYNFIIERFKSYDKQWKIFLCMEAPETWLKTFNDLPKKVEGLDTLFDYKPVKKANEYSAKQSFNNS